jgi:hypothetical protein
MHLNPWAAAVLSLSFLSCRHSHDEHSLGNAAQIARTVERLRLASNDEKRAWLNQLQRLPCQTDDVCQMKTLCTRAYEAHLAGIESIQHASSLVGATDAGGSWETADASAEVFLRAASQAQSGQRQLKLARQQTRACAENEAVIRQRYRL